MAIRWGILGAGSVAQRRVMPAMKAQENCAIQALMVRDLKRAELLAAQFAVPRAYQSVEALINDPNVDAVYVSSPVHLHKDHVLAVARAGKHVLCEKPMALSAEECQLMIDACERAGVHLQVCFVLRGFPIYHQVKGILEAGTLGHVVELRAHLAKWTPFAHDAWRIDPAQSGGGCSSMWVLTIWICFVF